MRQSKDNTSGRTVGKHELDKVISDLESAFQGVFDRYWDGTAIRIQPLLDILNRVAEGHKEGMIPDENEGAVEFFGATDAELRRISQIYHYTAMQLRNSEDKGRWFGKKKARVVPRAMISMRVGRGFKIASSQENLYFHTVLCVLYAKLHREVLRALTGFHDSLLGSTAGARYLEQVWTAGDDRGLFLHSALLRELEALQIIMTQKLGEKKCAMINPMKEPMPSSSEPGDAAEVSPLSFEGDSILQHRTELLSCPVCLEFMYRPHGLQCGHCLCTNCILAANKLSNAVGPSLRAMMSHIPFKKGTCPTCRQTITETPMELMALGRLVARTVPDHYKACNKAFRKKQAALQEKLENQQSEELGMNSNPLFPALDHIPSLFGRSGAKKKRPASSTPSLQVSNAHLETPTVDAVAA